MKDLDCSSNASRFAALFGTKNALKSNRALMDWPRALASFRFVSQDVAPGHFWFQRVLQALAVFSRGPKGERDVPLTRCERGADIDRMLGFSEATSQAIRALDEHWDGQGQPYRLKGEDIPLIGRFSGWRRPSRCSSAPTASSRLSTWHSPVEAAVRSRLGRRIAVDSHPLGILALAPGRRHACRNRIRGAGRLRVPGRRESPRCRSGGFAAVIDAKSPWTYRHSNGVAELSVSLIRRGLSVPLSDRFALTGATNLVTPAATGTVDAYMGVTFYPTPSVLRAARNRFAPLFCVANNPTMAIDLRR
jgi:hypothetical protein